MTFEFGPGLLALLGSVVTGLIMFGGTWLTQRARFNRADETLEQIHHSSNSRLDTALGQIEALKVQVGGLQRALISAKSVTPRILSLLLIEDSEADAELLIRALPGHVVIVASGAKDLQQALARGPFDAAMIDLAVPGLQWPVSLRAVRSRYPDLPVLAISGSMSDGRGQEAMAEGAQDYFAKGSNHAVLEHILQRVVAIGNITQH